MVLAAVSNCYSKLKGRFPRDTHPCATILTSEDAFSFDLHVLGLPPAFVLSQDQTLKFDSYLKSSHCYKTPYKYDAKEIEASLDTSKQIN